MTAVVTPLDCCVFYRVVHPLDLAVIPRMIGFGQPVLNLVDMANHVEPHRP